MGISVAGGVRALARLFTGSTYVLLGLDALRKPGGRVATAGPLLASMRRVAPLPDNDEVLVRANAGVMVVAGAALATGRVPRLASAALLGSMVPTTLAGHAYWTHEDPATRAAQRIQFHKNLAMLGGLLLAVVDRPKDRSAG